MPSPEASPPSAGDAAGASTAEHHRRDAGGDGCGELVREEDAPLERGNDATAKNDVGVSDVGHDADARPKSLTEGNAASEGGEAAGNAAGGEPPAAGAPAHAEGAAGNSRSNEDVTAHEGHRPQHNNITGEGSTSANADAGGAANDGGDATTATKNAGEGGGRISQAAAAGGCARPSAAAAPHETSTSQTLAETSTSPSDPAAERERSILAAIHHRRQLLAYIRHGRSACESVREHYNRGERRGFVSAMIRGEPEVPSRGGAKGEAAPAAAKPPTPLPPAKAATYEIADFRTIAQMAARNASSLKLLKRQRSGVDHHAGGGSSRDLRKGDKVGKKMTAAVNTLTHAGGWASASSSLSEGLQLHPASPGKMGAGGLPNAMKGPGKQFEGKHFHKQSGTKAPPIEKGKKGKKRKGGQSNEGSTTSLLGGATAKGGGGSAFGGGAAVRPLAASVPSLMAAQLLERRDGLMTRLDDVLGRDARKDDGGSRASREATTDEARPSRPPIRRHSPQQSPDALPSRLPPRRQTAWDRVLDEMKWMATDFCEERKWKVAAGQCLSAAIRQYKPKKRRRKLGSAASMVGSLPSSVRRTPSASSGRSRPSTPRSSPRAAVDAGDAPYVEPTPGDVEWARRAAHSLGVAVLECWEATADGDGGGGETRLGRQRHRTLREGATSAEDPEEADAEDVPSAPPASEGDDGSDTAARPRVSELSYDEISRRMEAAMERIRSMKNDDASVPAKGRKKSAKASDSPRGNAVGGVELDEGQLRSVRFVERLWEAPAAAEEDEASPGIAGIVGGGFGSGKTMAVCALLWKRRGAGPQLVVCSPAAVMRWKNELEKFDGLTVAIGNGSGSDASEGSDVRVYDYASFREWAAGNGGTVDASSLTLDLRHSSTVAASHLDSAKWWACLNQFVANGPSGMKRLVVEQTDLPHHRFIPSPRDGDAGKHVDGILAMKVAFVHHPSMFHSERASIGKRVISWAKREAKAKPRMGDGADSSPASSGYRSILAESLQNAYDSVVALADARKGGEHDSGDSPDVAWEVRMCSLAKPQREAYDQCCSEAGGSDEEMADCLLKLRRTILHADLDEALACFRPLLRRVPNAAIWSEPNIDVAENVMNKSAKMKELLRVLTIECGFDVGCQADLLDTAMVEDDAGEDGTKKRSKVLVLATLVEARLLTSYFLSAVGLRHEVVISPCDGPAPSALDATSTENESAWASSQSVLTQFNCGHVDVLIASPTGVSSQTAGVSVTSACTVISIDEDWSGREALHVMSVLSKIERHGREMAEGGAGTSHKFIKLICENTCEDTFLCRGNTSETKPPPATQHNAKARKAGKKRSSRRTAAPSKTSPGGEDVETKQKILLPPIATNPKEAAVDHSGFLVPPTLGSNIVRYRNRELSSVLCSEAPEGSESVALFMPTDESTSSHLNASFARALFNSERDASQLGDSTVECASTAPISVPASSVQCHVEVFRRSTLFSSQHQGEHNLHLLNQNGNLRVADGTDAMGNSDSSKSPEELDDTDLASGADDASLILYRLPGPNSRKNAGVATLERTNGHGVRSPDILSPRGDLAQSIFSLCFSSFNSSAPALIHDGNQGCDTLVYVPTFLPALFQILRNVMHATPEAPAGNSRTKRKELDGQIVVSDSKRSRISGASEGALSPNALDLPTSWRNTAAGTGSPTGSHANDVVSIVVETNPHSIGTKSGDVELLFNRRLLASDVEGTLSCQSWPSLSSMILITQKKQQPKEPSNSVLKIANHAEKKFLHKKAKKHHHVDPNPPSTRDKGTAYYGSDHLFGRSYTAREGIRPDFASSLVGQVRLQCRLSDLVSNSVGLPSVNARGPGLLGAIPHAPGESVPRTEKRNWSGISLPVGLKVPKRAKEFSASLEESPEPWTATEDAALQESLSRYGMNWQLAADSFSSGTKRSPTQCQNRWESLQKTATGQIESSSHPVMESAAPGGVFRFAINIGAGKELATETSPSANLSGQKRNSIWISAPQDALADANVSQPEAKKEDPLVSRMHLIKDVSKKQRRAEIPTPATTPTHESHTEAIQSARASMLAAANGVAPPRNEMWPLELLDFTKKQKAAAASQQARHRDISRGSAAQHPPPQPPQHHRGSVPVAVPVPVQYHQPQHQMYHAGQHPPYPGHMHHPGANNYPQPRMPRQHPRSNDQQKGST